MGRNRNCGRWAVALGSVILFALILPAWFSWLVCGALLVCGGVCLMR